MKILSPDVVQGIINAYIKTSLVTLELTRLREGHVSSGIIRKKYQKLENLIAEASHALRNQDISPIIPLATQLLEQAGFPVVADSTPFKNFCRKLQRSMIAMWQVEQKRVMGDYSDDV